MQDQLRNHTFRYLFFDVIVNLQLTVVTYLLNAYIGLYKSQFLPKWNHPVHLINRIAQQLAKRRHHVRHRSMLLANGHHVNGLQRVVYKMGIHLALQR
ncbi:hypothetical protein D3C74_385990 [compost metagenome]